MALRRTRYQMPDFIRDSLNESGLMDAYSARPAYQQNDYIGSLCVTRAKLKATRQKRLNQILDELESGGDYMKMEWTKSHPLYDRRCYAYLAAGFIRIDIPNDPKPPGKIVSLAKESKSVASPAKYTRQEDLRLRCKFTYCFSFLNFTQKCRVGKSQSSILDA